jgi:cell division septation protein DedD
LVLAISALAYQNWESFGLPQLTDVIAIPVKLLRSPELPVTPAARDDAPSTVGGDPSPGPNVAQAVQTQPARFVLEMGTFETTEQATQALDQLRSAGFGGYSIEVSTSDSSRAFAVFLGPYSERGPIERDLERARQIPGYDTARIVPIGPVELPAKPESRAVR